MAELIDTDVVIIGAGPTGLMLANCLARLAVRVVIVDHKPEPTRESRALVLQARTMEIFDQLGLVHRVLSEATIASAIRPGFAKRSFRSIHLKDLGEGVTPYSHLYVLEQSRNERILVDSLQDAGTDVRWGNALESLDHESGGGVRVRCRATDGDTVDIRARYCVGADGSSSRVRDLIAVEFEGKTNAHTFYVLDAAGVRGIDLDLINLRFAERDFLLTFPMGFPDHERLLGVVPDVDAVEATAREVLDRAFGVSYDTAAWFSTYRVHHRVARAFRAGPVFLAGDAAHVHSPVGAQGMNTGLQDAHNLAFKIADVLAGRATDSYLDRYEAERRPVARRLVATTDTMFGVITSERPVARLLRRGLIPLFAPAVVAVLPKLLGAPRIFEYLSQTRIHYWMSETARKAAHGRRGKVVGRRLPWNGDNYASLRTLAWQVHAYGSVPAAVTHDVEEGLGLPLYRFADIHSRKLTAGKLYLVRPDAFVAAIATPEDALQVFAAVIAWERRSAIN